MTDNEIIKALECCIEAKCASDCEKLKCPAFRPECCVYVGRAFDEDDFIIELIKDALDLIKRQQAEIEVLTAQNGVNETCSARKQETIERLEIELKAMRAAANGYKAEVEKLHSYKLHYGNLRMEIAREFADRVKDIIPAIDDTYIESMVEEHINDLLKEMEKEDESH